ncbi:MAG TPA: hypothetical protein VL334_15115 [Anaerolineae bacterium]|nr:hypothetical protein [Anaerolineae bacterium]
MSQPNSCEELNLFLMCKQLLQAGWDAFASDLTGEVTARRDHLPKRGTWTLTIDRSGRWRFTATHEIGLADGRELVRAGQTLRLLKEMQQVLTVAGNLRSQDDLPELLAELTQLAQEESGQTSPRAEGEPTWHEDHELRAEMSDL